MLAPKCLPRAAFSGFPSPPSPRAPLPPLLFLSKEAIEYERTGGTAHPKKRPHKFGTLPRAERGARAALVSVTLIGNRDVSGGPVSGVLGARVLRHLAPVAPHRRA